MTLYLMIIKKEDKSVLDRIGLKAELLTCYGTAKEINPFAMVDLIEVDKVDLNVTSDDELIELAKKAGINAEKYMSFDDGI